ncbi:MAG: fumarylacetoacetate hydrolase family protein [Pseudomonadota bacterium]
MPQYKFDPLVPYGLPVNGEDDLYPVNRIFCVGRNYAKHAAEMGVEVDREKPFYFTKSPSTATASGTTVAYPKGTENYHFEVELVVAIGPGDRSVFGYCTGLDMTRRDLQLAERAKQRPWSLGKDVEQSCVLAPLTKAVDMAAPIDQRIWLTQNGETRQDASLAELIWTVPEILNHLSGFYNLGPGDLIMTGTPAGVGPVEVGDVLEGGVDGLDPVHLTIGPTG